jgi:putative ABC transport system permease protein
VTSFGIVTSGLRRRLLRTSLMVLSLAVTTALLCITTSAFLRFQGMRTSDALLPRVIVNSPTVATKLPATHAERIKRLPGAEWVWVLESTRGSDSGDLQFLVWAGDETFFQRMPAALIAAPADQLAAFKGERGAMLASPSLLDRWKKKIGDSVTFPSGYGPLSGRIVGELTGAYPTGMDLLAMHYEHLQQSTTPEKRGRAGYIVAGGGDMANLRTLAKTIDDEFAGDGDPTISLPSWQSLDSGIYRPMMLVPNLMRRIAVLLVLVTTLVTSSTLAMSLRERRRDFGILRALGFSRGRVFRLVFTEMFLICFLGTAIGTGVPYAFFHRQGLDLGGFIMSNVTVDPFSVLVAAGTSLALVAFATLWPAAGTARLNVVETLGKA